MMPVAIAAQCKHIVTATELHTGKKVHPEAARNSKNLMPRQPSVCMQNSSFAINTLATRCLPIERTALVIPPPLGLPPVRCHLPPHPQPARNGTKTCGDPGGSVLAAV